MTRLYKTTNRQDANEKADRIWDYIKAGKSNDKVYIREFTDGTGQIFYEVWLQRDKDLSRKA